MTAVLEAVDATKSYGEVLGLNGFTATVGPGTTGLIGPNGAGKSTLFRLLVGQLHLDRGRLELLGHPAGAQGEFRRRVGYCPEHFALYDWMTGLEFVTGLLRVDGFGRAEARGRAGAAIETVGLADAAHRRIRVYSRGMRQRVKLAQAIAHDPELLLLDEPLNGVDPVGRAHLIDLFERLARDGRHLLVSSHVLYEVERLTESIVMISNGRALAQGDFHRIRDLLDARPHTIDLATPDPRGLARVLSGWDHVVAVEFPADGRLTVRSRAPETFYRDLPGVVVAEGIRVTAMRSVDDNLDAVFRYLTEGRG
ncbi:MAG TPA: ABC transporter ATP-binding protein [Thermoplasmata archaeon]|nr:ABC transporter ATP-binding protein [Thermoplasmata archaeon]